MPTCAIQRVHPDRVEAANQRIADAGTIDRMAELFKALGDPTRLKILLSLSAAELCVCDLAAVCAMSDSAISHQLRILRNLRLVRFRREKKMVFYRLDDEHIEDLITQGLDHIREDRAGNSVARTPD